MSDFPDRYRYTYTMALRHGSWRHSYVLLGRDGAIDFHVLKLRAYKDEPETYNAGLEVHRRTPQAGPPTADDCLILKAPCWHDGTTVYAEEKLLPLFDPSNHDRIWQALTIEADRIFGEPS